jgi:hypothetical protein
MRNELLVVHREAFTSQQEMKTAVAEPAALRRQAS